MLPMHNPFRRSATQPINIGHSSPDRYNHGVRIDSSNTQPDGEDSSFDEEDLHHHRVGIDREANSHGHNNGHMNINNLSSSFANVAVGSLPSSRRERRFMVSHGNNERLASYRTDGGVNDSVSVGGVGINMTTGRNDLARSMPVPHAPYLCSKRDFNSRARLSRIPSMQLPESVTDTSEASSMPYGSLNESQFRIPSSANSKQDGNASGNGNVASSYNPSAGSGLDIQKKVQEMRKAGSLIKNDQGGLASLFGGGAAAGNTAIFGGDGDGDGDGDGSDQDKDEDRQEVPHGSDKDINSQMCGIGSLIEHSTLTQRMQNEPHPQKVVPIGSIPVLQQDQSQSYSQSYSHSHIHAGITDPCESQLSGSLTGLIILKESPRGMVDLDPAQREAMESMRSRSSEDRSAFLQPTLEGIASRPDTYATSTLTPFGDMENDLRPVRRFSNESDHSPLQGQEGNGDEDIDDLFNLDM